MRVLQALPALHSGGVERGTVEFAAELVSCGHESFVVSNGGPLVERLTDQGSTHFQQPIHRKNLASLAQIWPVRQMLLKLRPDIVHVRSRMPAWIIHLAIKTLPQHKRPVVISTFHGMYSVNAYSAVMTRADHLIAVSHCVKDYILKNYPVPASQVTVIHRGVNRKAFQNQAADTSWQQKLLAEHPKLASQKIIMMPGRLTRWKGQLDFLKAMAQIVLQEPDCHGLIVGGAEPGKAHFEQELQQECARLGLNKHVTFLGQRSDMSQLYRFADVVCHMSTKAEPFGRTLTEALASGTPVVAYDRGGAAESLQACFPEGLVKPDDLDAFVERVVKLAVQPPVEIHIPDTFWLEAQVEETLGVYHNALQAWSRQS